MAPYFQVIDIQQCVQQAVTFTFPADGSYYWNSNTKGKYIQVGFSGQVEYEF